MSLMSSMYAGISGLTAHSQAMSVIGNNLANTSTTGFKKSTMQFEDLFYSTIFTANSYGQVGHGVTVSSIYGDFSQGAYQSTNSATDLAIGGSGFFMVRDSGDDITYYTRAGNFNFDSYGYLIDPNGYVVQGWQASTNDETGVVSRVGALGDIRLDSFQSPPQATTELELISNLNLEAEDFTSDPANPFFSLFQVWDGQDDPQLADTAYSYQDTITVYDEAGSAHDITVYYDRASNASGDNVWEFIVTCAPDEDGRTIGGVEMSTTSGAGLLMTGTLSFDSSGMLAGMSAFTPDAASTSDLKDLSNWVPAEFNEEGYPLFTANFTGQDNADFTSSPNAVNISLDLGIHSAVDNGGWTGGVANASLVGANVNNLPDLTSGEVEATATTSYGSPSSTIDSSQDGYSAGYLLDITVTDEGVVVGRYSNSQIQDLFILGLADFDNLQGLSREGGNLYSQTRESGEPRIGTADDAGMGTIASGYLEQSNVDTAEEMVRMITIQRGFQANSKVITTVDTMLAEVLQLKR